MENLRHETLGPPLLELTELFEKQARLKNLSDKGHFGWQGVDLGSQRLIPFLWPIF